MQRYSQVQVTMASNLASRHRARARAYGQTEHFTPWEWLDLCDGFNFRCPLCGVDEPLSPHHGVLLSEGGGNNIDNILPLCEDCHGLVHWTGAEYTSGWMARQQVLRREMTPGSVVEHRPANSFYDAPSAMMRGVVVSVAEPVPCSPLDNTSLDSSMDHGSLRRVLAAEGTRVRPWFPAQAQVRFLGQSDECACDLDTLTKLEPDEYLAEQDAWLAHQTNSCGLFLPGDQVNIQHRGSELHGVVVRVIKPTIGPSWEQVEGISGPWAALWTLKTPAMAAVDNIQGNPVNEMRLELDELRALELSPTSALPKDDA